ncbi:hypothetical protein [Streptomyces sp. HUAS ZL42]|uniref:hypothetical protein n=1 Tax=Streptomyces sp. HUAS ZL42 TaxID=3231715 RepID=UPI00345E1036
MGTMLCDPKTPPLVLPAPVGLREMLVHLLLAAMPEFLGALAATLVVAVTPWALQRLHYGLARTARRLALGKVFHRRSPRR